MLKRIRRVFGTEAFLRIQLLLIGKIGMSIGGWFFLSSLVPAAITAGGFIVGWTLRNQIAARIEIIPQTVRICLLAYGRVLFFGKQMDLDQITHCQSSPQRPHRMDLPPAILVSFRSECRSDRRLSAGCAIG